MSREFVPGGTPPGLAIPRRSYPPPRHAASAERAAVSREQEASVPGRFASVVDAHVILPRAGLLLLLRRAGDVSASGQLCLPSGHLESGEDVRQAGAREVLEETGITLDPAELAYVLSIHRRNPGTRDTRIGFVFTPASWDGEPVNAEPHKHSGLLWADPAALPADTAGYTAAIITAAQRGLPFTVSGW